MEFLNVGIKLLIVKDLDYKRPGKTKALVFPAPEYVQRYLVKDLNNMLADMNLTSEEKIQYAYDETSSPEKLVDVWNLIQAECMEMTLIDGVEWYRIPEED